METIKLYLDNMFSGLPKTDQMTEIKNNILSNMEDKYNELKAAGKSENEAIGIVISEFGNIDELVNELGIRRENTTDNTTVITKEETYSYLAAKKTMGIQIATGVFLCIMSPAVLILISTLYEQGRIFTSLSKNAGDMLGIIPLFILVAIAVGIFIYSGMNFEKYQYIEDGIDLPLSVKSEIQQKYNRFIGSYNKSLVVSIIMIILSPIAIFVTSSFGEKFSSYGVVILLTIVAIAVYILVYTGMIQESYYRLLKLGNYTEKTISREKENKVIGAVASVIWPLSFIIYLYSGFVNSQWGTAWVVFPITGILFGMFSAVFSIITKKD